MDALLTALWHILYIPVVLLCVITCIAIVFIIVSLPFVVYHTIKEIYKE